MDRITKLAVVDCKSGSVRRYDQARNFLGEVHFDPWPLKEGTQLNLQAWQRFLDQGQQ